MLVHQMTSAAAAAADTGGADFSWGTLLLFVAGFLALAVVSSLGFIARIRDRANERRAELARAERSHQPDTPSASA